MDNLPMSKISRSGHPGVGIVSVLRSLGSVAAIPPGVGNPSTAGDGHTTLVKNGAIRFWFRCLVNTLRTDNLLKDLRSQRVLRLDTQACGGLDGMDRARGGDATKKRWGNVAVTIKDIARQAGVSTATVSKVLNRKDSVIGDETRQKVLSLARELNYTPNSLARSLVTRKSHVIGIIVPDIMNPYFTELVRSCDDAARLRGYTTLVCNSEGVAEIETAHLSSFGGHRVDGILLAASDVIPDVTLLDALRIPVVCMDREIGPTAQLVATIDTDYRSGAFLATRHMIEKGHTRIAFLSGAPHRSNTQIRLLGYKDALRDAGIPFDPQLIRCKEFQHRFGYQATLDLVDETPFSAICCMNDMLAIGAMVALRERGLRVPDDCAVIGFDNIYLAPLLEHPLSTVDRCIGLAGRLAANALMDFLDDADRRGAAITITPTVVSRSTT
jgi:LacI family transcriptional regulator